MFDISCSIHCSFKQTTKLTVIQCFYITLLIFEEVHNAVLLHNDVFVSTSTNMHVIVSKKVHDSADLTLMHICFLHI